MADSTFAAMLCEDFAKHGGEVIQKLRETNPGAYLKLCASMQADMLPDLPEMNIDAQRESIREKLERLIQIRKTGPFWSVDFKMEPVDDIAGGDITIEIQAPTCKEALMWAVYELELIDGELIHTIHIGKPREKEATVVPQMVEIAKRQAPWEKDG